MENFSWTVDEYMFTYVMKSRIEELIEEKLNQEFPAEVETRDSQEFESDEEMTSETVETDDDSEPNIENVNKYLDSAIITTNLESAMKLAEKEDLRIGDSGASSHMMGSEEHVFNTKLISGSLRTVEKLQFSFYLDLLSPEIHNSLGSFVVLPKDCLFTCIFHTYENFYKLSKMHCLLILFSTSSPSEVSENRNSAIKHISTYTLFHPSISTYVVDHFLVISCL